MDIKAEALSLIHAGKALADRGFTLMHLAVLLRSPLAVNAMLNAGLLPKEDSRGITPLHLAAFIGDADICKKIVIAYPNERFVCAPGGHTAAEFALVGGHHGLVPLLRVEDKTLAREEPVATSPRLRP